ncbi:prenyltransferase/squalene oxidase repeat-containing protein [Tundrisphaera lichenicola]|uniref:prenyltransferase/squalene oxidase repeat-containing protein n=1 Tax=Tundrisphaera lichenicola TaxID=2029860 RepID=UPI003EB9F027
MSHRLDRRRFLVASGGAFAFAISPSMARAELANSDELKTKAVSFLRSRQKADGSWSSERGPGISALAVTALLRSGRSTAAEPTVVKGLAYLEGFISPKGGLAEGPQSNYVTSVALMAFHEANTKGQYDAQIKAGQDYLKGLQWDEGEGKGPDDPYFGGAGYGGRSRPDLSNTSFFMDALRDTGLPADDPSLRKALTFVSRCQNLKSEFNDQPWAEKVNDGGFIYSAASGGVSMAVPPTDANGGLRSYASMTYAGLKSMIHAGLKPDDPRVKAATDYIARHYSVDENPGLGQSGLYYYYQTFAKALSLLGKANLVDAEGQAHDWKSDLVAALAKRQADDGSWVNPADRFMEGDPNLVTSYALLALAYAK